MAALKALHIVTLLVWCAGLLYLPGLFAYSRLAPRRDLARLHIATRFTFVVVMSPAAVLAIVSGSVLAAATAAQGGWLLLKLTVVAAMVVFHLYCGRMVTMLDVMPRLRGRWIGWLSAVPVVLILAVLWLVLAKPF